VELVGGRFGGDSLGSVALIAILSGSVAVSILNGIGSLRTPRNEDVQQRGG
jgi:hypothetical protein